MTLAVLFSAGYAGFETSDSLERLQTTAIWFGGIYSFVAICQWYTGGGKVLWLIQTPYDSDIAGTFGNRDHYAALIALLLPVALARIVAGRHSGLIAAACAGLMFASVLACGSRAGTLVVCAEALIFVGVACFGRRRNVPAAALVAVSLALCTAIGGWTLVWERFASGNFLSHRREMLTSTIHMIQARPLTGFGLGSWPTVYPAFAVFDPPGIYMNHAHNDWAEWASDGGLLLALGLAVVAVAAAVNCRKNLWSLGIPAVFVHAMADFPLHKPAIACAVFFLAGASFSRRTVTEAKQAAGFDSCEPQLPSMRLRSQNSRS
jgi:O-antigen ligase